MFGIVANVAEACNLLGLSLTALSACTLVVKIAESERFETLLDHREPTQIWRRG